MITSTSGLSLVIKKNIIGLSLPTRRVRTLAFGHQKNVRPVRTLGFRRSTPSYAHVRTLAFKKCHQHFILTNARPIPKLVVERLWHFSGI
jgi:hypothetical protein